MSAPNLLTQNSLRFGELKKYPSRIELFKKKVKENELFELRKEIIKENGEKTRFIKIKKEQFPIKYTINDIPKKLEIEDVNIKIPLGYLRKTKEFGSRENKGNQFEKDYYLNLKHSLKNPIFNYIKGNIKEIVHEGLLNKKRPLIIKDKNNIYIGDNNFKIGNIISDITIKTNIRDYYLSLKFGKTITFINSGIIKYLSKEEIIKGNINNKNGIILLNLLGIDKKKFCNIFNSYNPNNRIIKKEVIDITEHINNITFKTFLKSIIGFNYILVHKNQNKTNIINMTEEKMKSICNIKKANIFYPINGCAKRIDIIIEMKGLKMKINLRNKQGGIYPTHIMADYELLDN